MKLKRVRLKLSVTSLIFFHLPEYLSNKPLPKCFDPSTALHQYKKKLYALGTKNSIEEDSFLDLEFLKIKIDNTVLPSDCLNCSKMCCKFHCFSKNCADVNSAAKFTASIIITKNLIPNAFVDSVHIPEKIHEHSLSSSSVNSQIEVCSTLAFCKNVFNECLEDCVNKTVLAEIAVDVL